MEKVMLLTLLAACTVNDDGLGGACRPSPDASEDASGDAGAGSRPEDLRPEDLRSEDLRPDSPVLEALASPEVAGDLSSDQLLGRDSGSGDLAGERDRGGDVPFDLAQEVGPVDLRRETARTEGTAEVSPEAGPEVSRDSRPEARPEPPPEVAAPTCPAYCSGGCFLGCDAAGKCQSCSTCTCSGDTGLCHC